MNDRELKMANSYLKEAETETGENGLIKIFYNDLDLKTRQKILEAIDKTSEFLDVFGDEVVKAKIEDQFATKPIFTIGADELVNRMNFDI